ncbi:MAG: DNA adenine methylase [Candidatus Brockarchaeota archaeon]|nr:DNA adenine methylase [Candidatus Brockarchaeota archaeon]MBO3809308.1 DNA adenine methylase [Candidatus Brockarchaeota archaeon]
MVGAAQKLGLNKTPSGHIGGRAPEPFVKWAGGKSQLLKVFSMLYPRRFKTYYEPFLGGGAVFFDLYAKHKISRAVLSDLNADLMNLWAAIRENVDELISQLEALRRKVNDRDFYYEKRKEFNSIKLRENFLEEPDIRKASLLIFLNKTCYNGLYRVNAKGEFNVPFGRYRNPQLFNEANLRAVHQALKDRDRIRLLCMDFQDAVKDAEKGDFIYFDPPYQPIGETANFTEYTAGGFGPDEQKRLAEVFGNMDERGCFLMLSNSSKREFLEPLYKPYFEKGYVLEVKAARAISSIGSKRGPVKEFVIMNYAPNRDQNLSRFLKTEID